jgi:excinuclease ABC subunit C
VVASDALADIPGLGPARRTALLRAFGSVKRLRNASVDELQQVSGVGPALAATIHAALARPADADEHGGVAFDAATGEIMAP